MEKKIVGLHSAARKYCIERIAYWHRKYFELGKDNNVMENGIYTNKALSIFPRYNVLYAVLYEIEKFLPEDFSDLEEATELIILAGQTAGNVYTKPTIGEIEKNSIDDERNVFENYIRNLSADVLDGIEPLFFRQVLSKTRSIEIWDALRDKWDIAECCYWFPLKETSRKDIIAFQDKYFCSEVDIGLLNNILKGRNIERVFELKEDRTEYEIDLSQFNPYYNGDEGFWCSRKFDWVIYASHESSIAVAGDWLIDKIKGIWPNWESRIYVDPFFE